MCLQTVWTCRHSSGAMLRCNFMSLNHVGSLLRERDERLRGRLRQYERLAATPPDAAAARRGIGAGAPDDDDTNVPWRTRRVVDDCVAADGSRRPFERERAVRELDHEPVRVLHRFSGTKISVGACNAWSARNSSRNVPVAPSNVGARSNAPDKRRQKGREKARRPRAPKCTFRGSRSNATYRAAGVRVKMDRSSRFQPSPHSRVCVGSYSQSVRGLSHPGSQRCAPARGRC